MCAMMLVALIAALAILVLAGIVALILFNPQTTDFNSEIQTLRQQVESLRMTVTQIQQANVSSSEGTAREEISKQVVQEMIDISIQELQLHMNSSIQEIERKVQYGEQKIDSLVISVESQNNLTRSWLNNQLTNTTVTLRKAVYEQLKKVESQVNTTPRNVQQINFELPSVLENATTPLVMNIHHLRDWTNKSLENLKLQCTNVIHDLEQRFNQSQNDKNATASKSCVYSMKLE